VTAETEAIVRAIAQLERATVDEPREYWQALLDDLERFVDLEIASNSSIAFKYVVALRDRTDPAGTRQGRVGCIEDATVFLERALQRALSSEPEAE
jgi:hypothetical protein